MPPTREERKESRCSKNMDKEKVRQDGSANY